MRFLNSFKRRTVKQIAENELDEARASLLKTQSGLDYAITMTAYQYARVSRLEKYLNIPEDEQTRPPETFKFSKPNGGSSRIAK